MTRQVPKSFRHWDVFICHASEDKDQVARPLAEALQSLELRVWYDEFSLRIGDSLRRKIEHGLAKSRFGVVIVSSHFFEKKWPQWELDLLFNKEMKSRGTRILPVWHNIDQQTVAKYSLGLADRVAAKTSEGIDSVARQIAREVASRKTSGSDGSAEIDGSSVDIGFKGLFSTRLLELRKKLESVPGSTEVDDTTDSIIMLVRDRIDKWDIPSVRFATRELFLNLYKFYEDEILHDLYQIFEDLFVRAHFQRRRILGEMIKVLSNIMFETWAKSEDIGKGTSAAEILTRLGQQFLGKDLEVVKDCLSAIDNLAGDYFDPEILSKEILLACAVFQVSRPTKEVSSLFTKAVDWIRINDQYAWDAGIYDYLRDAIDYAEFERTKFGLSITQFKKEHLYPILEGNIESQVEDFAKYIAHEVDTRGELSYEIESLVQLIASYEGIKPDVSAQIHERVLKENKSKGEEIFNRIVSGSSFLRTVYGRGKMITTIEQLIKFIESNADIDNLKVGFTTFGISWIEFVRNVREQERNSIQELLRKYHVKDELEITENRLTFEMDHLVYLRDRGHDMKQLISFLREMNEIIEINSFTSSFNFQMRRLTPP